jgi:stage II sporulation protein D
MGDNGWRIPGSHGRWLLAAGAAAFVAWSAVLLPSGCQGPSSTRTPRLPPSPLEQAQAQAGGSATTPPTAEPVVRPERPKPPALRPIMPLGEPVVRVRVATIRGEPVTLSHPSGWLWVKPDGEAAGRTVRTPVAIRAAPGGWMVVESSDRAGAERVMLRGEVPLVIEPMKGWTREIQWKGGDWPGDATLVRRPDEGGDAADLVFSVPMETYLPGVLAKELYKGWTDEAYRAQAVAARSYALCEHAWWQGRRHYDVVAGQASQAWVGSTADATSRRAVQDTAGQYLMHDGRVVPAYYSSCCGGAPASATDAIREGSWMDIAPLSVDDGGDARPRGCCEKAPTARWRISLGTAELARRLNAWAEREGRKDLGALAGVKSISVAEANPAGRPVSFRIADPRGRKVLWDAEDLRYAVNAGASGAKDSLKSGFVSPRIDGGRVVFDGRGHGHGAGMCQFGAEAMGRAGRSHEQILRRYYPGATIESAADAVGAQASLDPREGN